MKPSVFFALLLLGIQSFCMAQTAKGIEGELVWHTDFAKARELSDATHKPIFGFFTGSDWCGWCHKLEADVFAKEAFVTWAKKNVVLLELDFPKTTPNSSQK